MTNGTNPQGYDKQSYSQQNPYYQQPQPYNQEKKSIKSMLRIGGIIAIIIGIIYLLYALGNLFWVLKAFTFTGGPMFFLLIWSVAVGLVCAIIDFVICGETKKISDMVDRGMYREAQSKTLVWTILGFILGGVIVGIVLLIAYLKFDPLIRAQMQQYPLGEPYQQPPPQYQQ